MKVSKNTIKEIFVNKKSKVSHLAKKASFQKSSLLLAETNRIKGGTVVADVQGF